MRVKVGKEKTAKIALCYISSGSYYYSVQKSKEVGHEATYLPCNKTLPTCILIPGITVFVRCGSIPCKFSPAKVCIWVRHSQAKIPTKTPKGTQHAATGSV